MSLLSGPVLFIDDELEDVGSQACSLLQEILSTSRPVATHLTIPEDYLTRLQHWQSLAFVIVDWDLSPGSMGSYGGATLSEFERRRLYDFLNHLMGEIYCPIFIVSGEDVIDIRRQIMENGALLTPSGELDPRVAIFPKDVIVDRLTEHLTLWVSMSPSLAALTSWEREYEAAKNRLFIDMNFVEPDWPSYVWQAADGDQVDPAFELSSVISSNLLNRFSPVVFDGDALSAFSLSASGEARRKVSQGRTSVPGDRISDRMVLPGDLFVLPGEADGEVWMNVSPACHTVPRTRAGAAASSSGIHLHLLRGFRQPWPKSDGELKSMDSKDRTNSIVIHTVLDGHPYKFVFGDARMERWETIREHRVARLLPPFVTRVQQLHAAYIQSEGLPKVTLALYGE